MYISMEGGGRMALEALTRYEVLSGRYKRLWSDWEIRIFVLASLALQVILIFLAPRRKVHRSSFVRFILWSFYLLADSVANFALGHLADNQSGDEAPKQTSSIGHYHDPSHRGGGGGAGSDEGSRDYFNSQLLAFWAPFLLLHLGGQDTITAFSLEDNELWLRHLTGLFFQLFACGYVLYRSEPKNPFLLPTLLMLLVGSIKYVERTCSLYLGSTGGFRDSMLKKPDPGPMYFKLMDEYQAKKEAGLNPQIKIVRENEIDKGDLEAPGGKPEEEDDVETLNSAFKFFNIYKSLVVDLVLSFQERKESRDYFLKLEARKAFRVVAMELNFLYDVLYTKSRIAHSECGLILRAVCTAGILASYLIFFFHHKKGLNRVDVYITYALLLGGLALDLVNFIMLLISDRTLVYLASRRTSYSRFPDLSKFAQTSSKRLARLKAWFERKQWSEQVSQLSLLRYCLFEVPTENRLRHRCVHGPCMEVWTTRFCLEDFFKEIAYTCRKPLHNNLYEFIYDQLKSKSEKAVKLDETKKLIESKGLYVLEEAKVKMENDDDKLRRSVQMEFDECVLLWHIATDLCLFYDGGKADKHDQEKNKADPQVKSDNDQTEKTAVPNSKLDEDPEKKREEVRGENAETKYCQEDHRELSKQLSEYMLYLLVMQTDLMSAMGGIGVLRYRDTCEEARVFFRTTTVKLAYEDACKMLLGVKTEAANPADVKGDRSKSVLFDGCILAKTLEKLQSDHSMSCAKKWEVIAKVWVELLSYAACHCRGIQHARKLSTGGELLGMVWLLMAQLGLGDQFRTETGQARAKLVFDK